MKRRDYLRSRRGLRDVQGAPLIENHAPASRAQDDPQRTHHAGDAAGDALALAWNRTHDEARVRRFEDSQPQADDTESERQTGIIRLSIEPSE